MISPGKRGVYLLWLSAWRHAGQHRWQTALAFLGILLGVMMVVAVDLANSSARRAFALSIETVNGNITHQIVGGSNGVPDHVFTALRRDLGLRRSAPTLTGTVRSQGQELTLLGLDLISESSLERRRPGFSADRRELLMLGFAALGSGIGVLTSTGTAAALGLQPDDSFELRVGNDTRAVRLVGTFASNEPVATENLLFADVATAQHLLGRRGSLDSIDLILDEAGVARVQAWLPPGLTLVASDTRNAALAQMTEAFHVNLLAMSLLALLVAALLIYNTVSLSVLQRQSVFGVLRALGVTRGELLTLVLLETLVLGLAASAAGTLAGLALGQVLVQLVTRTIDDLYFSLTVTRFLLDPLVLAKGLFWGTALALLAAFLPAWQAGNSAPVTLRQGTLKAREWRRRLPALAGGGLLLLGAGFVLLAANATLVGGFVALNLLIFGFCLLVPLAVERLLALLQWLAGPRLPQTVRLALRNIQAGIARTGLAVAALTVAVSVTVGVGIMVGSFRDTVILWLDQTLAGDLQVTRLDEGALPATLANGVRALPEVIGLEEGFTVRAESDRGPVRVMATGSELDATLYIKELSPAARAAVEAGEGLLVSEPFAALQGLATGEPLTLQGSTGSASLPVLGIFYDYSTGPGMVALAGARYRQLWPERGPQRLTLTLAEDVDTAVLSARLRRLTADAEGSYGVAANADIRRLTLAIFDRTFAITHVLRLLAVVVAFVGVLSALLALQLERMREYALLRASGMTVREVGAMIGVQTLAMGLCAGLLALPLGLLMSEILIEVINRRSFGWSMQHSVPLAVLGEALLLALGAALLAGIHPARLIARIAPASALRQE